MKLRKDALHVKHLIFITITTIIMTIVMIYHYNTGITNITTTEIPRSNPSSISNIDSSTILKQNFKLENNNVYLKSLDIMLDKSDDSAYSDLLFSLYSGPEELLFSTTICDINPDENGYISIPLGDSVYLSGEHYYTIQGTDAVAGSQTVSPTIMATNQNNICTRLYINNEQVSNNIHSVFTYYSKDYSTFYMMIVSLLIIIIISLFEFPFLRSLSKISIFLFESIIFITNFVYITQLSEIVSCNKLSMEFSKCLLTYCLLAFITILVWGVCGRLLYSIIFTDTLVILLSFINYFVIQYRGEPFVPANIFAIQTLNAVISKYSFIPTSRQLAYTLSSVTIFTLIYQSEKIGWFTFFHLFKKKSSRIIMRGVFILVGTIGIFTLTNPTFLEKHDATSYTWNKMNGIYSNGSILNFVVNAGYTRIKSPNGYSTKTAEDILNRYSSEYDYSHPEPIAASADNDIPNIIMIMNESLADFNSIPGCNIPLSDDPLKFIHSLSENTIKGNCYISGSGTSNTEFEALTSNSLAFYPPSCNAYQQFSQNTMTGLTSDLKQLGYNCIAMHPENGANWNRNNVYKAMKFDDFFDISQFSGAEYIRWISDNATYEKIIEIFNKNNASKSPLFILDVTMQGHGGYDYTSTWEEPITVNNASYGDANEYFSSVKVSDKAFSNLVNFFKEQNEKTIILMYGDHQPHLSDEFLKYVFGYTIDDNISLDQLQKQFIVPYVLWANYDIEEAKKDVSANSLSLILKEAAGIEFNDYNKFISIFNQTIPIINANGYMDTNNVWHEIDEDNEYSELINEYRIVQYYMYNECSIPTPLD